MRYAKFASPLVLTMFLCCANAMAQSKPEPDQPPAPKAEKDARDVPPAKADQPPRAMVPVELDPVGKPEPDVAADKPAPPPKKKPIKRRSVQQVIEPVAPVYRPTLTPPSATPPVVLPSTRAMTSVNPPPPVQINSCDAGGCTDVNGVRHNGGIGNATVTPQGRPCTRVGTTIQCP